METEIQINDEILKLTNKIKEIYLELLKYIMEMPVKTSYTSNSVIDVSIQRLL